LCANWPRLSSDRTVIVDSGDRVERARAVEQALLDTASPDHGSLGSLKQYEIGVGVPEGEAALNGL
jgi:hypothetical protein